MPFDVLASFRDLPTSGPHAETMDVQPCLNFEKNTSLLPKRVWLILPRSETNQFHGPDKLATSGIYSDGKKSAKPHQLGLHSDLNPSRRSLLYEV